MNKYLRGLWRGKCKETGQYKDKWITGLPIKCWSKFYSDWTIHIIRLDDTGKEIGRYEVYPKTLGMCTGLYDCEENPIFEGDLLQNKYYNTYDVVVWNNEIAGFILQNSNDTHKYIKSSFIQSSQTKVVGNIHDNPDLINHRMMLLNADRWKSLAKQVGIDDETIEKLEELA